MERNTILWKWFTSTVRRTSLKRGLKGDRVRRDDRTIRKKLWPREWPRTKRRQLQWCSIMTPGNYVFIYLKRHPHKQWKIGRGCLQIDWAANRIHCEQEGSQTAGDHVHFGVHRQWKEDLGRGHQTEVRLWESGHQWSFKSSCWAEWRCILII